MRCLPVHRCRICVGFGGAGVGMGLALLISSSALAFVAPHTHINSDRAVQAFDELQARFWNASAGRFDSSIWWQQANAIEAVVNLALRQPATRPAVEQVIASAFNATSNATRGRTNKGVDLTFSGYFDDEEWWGLAWLRAYNLTGNVSYLARSREVFDDLATRAWSNTSCGGGVCWQASPDPADMVGCYKNAITNELFLTHAAQLALVYKARCATSAGPRADCDSANHTTTWVRAQLDWVLKSGMINGSNLVNDGLDTFDNHAEVCLNNRHTAYTYNQGVILSGLAYAWQLFPEQLELLQTASRIVTATFASSLVHAGTKVLRDMSEPTSTPLGNLYLGGPGADGLQFKSVFVRHLAYFLDVIDHAGPQAEQAVRAAGGAMADWRLAIQENADSIWSRAACAEPGPTSAGSTARTPALFGYLWRGPCSYAFAGPSATTQVGAIDVFTAAMAPSSL